jgi:DNA invertase Pin-like site-specific DNA recombinase
MNTNLPAPASTPRVVVGYVRNSPRKAKDKNDDVRNTLDAQRHEIERYCAYKQDNLADVIVDKDESAFSIPFLQREKVGELLERVQELGATGIVITKLDRGFRNALDCLFTVEALQKRGIGIHLLDLQLDPDTPVGKLLLTMLAAIAEFENRRRAERQITVFDELKAQGKLCGTVPYGWKLGILPDSADQASSLSSLLPDQDEQRVLHQIVHWIELDGLGVSTIARYLNQAGTPTKNGGKKWYPATVASVYKHRRLSTLNSQLSTSQAAA